MAITLFNTQELIQIQRAMPSLPDGFWRQRFPRVVTSDREEIMFEQLDIDDRRLAPFVAPNVQGRVMRSQGFSAATFRPAYVKPKHIVDPTKAIPRAYGEPILGGQSLEQRFNAMVANNLRLERESCERRWDWMACKAAADGFVVVAGDDYPSVTVDFRRDASLTITLSGTARWDQTATADPLTDLAEASDSAFDLGSANITDFVFGRDAWRNFLANADVQQLLSTQFRGSSSDFQRTVLVPAGNFQQMGQISGPTGQFNLWRYSNWYNDVSSTGAKTRREFLDPKEVVGLSEAMNGVAAYGAILDVKANFVAQADVFPKMWEEDDPSVVYTMTQSAPLYVPTNPNATFKMRVIT
jgi:hypothetical protein